MSELAREVPDMCPGCRAEDMFITAVDITVYDGTEQQYHGAFMESVTPEDQDVRVFCGNCSEHLFISQYLRDKLVGRVR